jgi:hypothetical protein
MDDQFWILRLYSWFTKFMSLLFLLFGLALEGAIIYAWGRFTAFFDMINTAWKAFADSYNLYNTTGISLPSALAPLSLWPVVVVMAVLLMLTVIFTFSLWVGGEWIAKALNTITMDLAAVAGYFSSLPSPRNKS